MAMQQTILKAIQDKSPELYASLVQSGEIGKYAKDLEDQTSSVTVDLTQHQRAKEKWDKLGTVACAAKMKMAAVLNKEIALQSVLEFPQEQTSQASQDETMNSDPMT
jgi:hypothetical protein